MENRISTLGRAEVSVLQTNKVIRNTYMLLSLTLAFSALTAGLSMAMGAPRLGILITLAGYFGLLRPRSSATAAWASCSCSR
jgi:modulator of FtsH protease